MKVKEQMNEGKRTTIEQQGTRAKRDDRDGRSDVNLKEVRKVERDATMTTTMMTMGNTRRGGT